MVLQPQKMTPGHTGRAPLYQDDGKLRPQDNVDVECFIGSGDRAEVGDGTPQPFFSGREREVGAFFETLFHFGRGHRENLTQVFEGPPGSGKSALMAQCMAETKALAHPASGGCWLPVRLPASATGSPNAIVKRINRAILRHLASDKGASERQGVLAAVNELAESAPADERTEAHNAAELIHKEIGELVAAPQGALDKAVDDFARRLRRWFQAAKGGTAAQMLDRGFSLPFLMSLGPQRADEVARFDQLAHHNERPWEPYHIVLFIDEANNIPVEEHLGQVKELFTAVHEGTTPVKIAVCAFGLTGTADKLRLAGVSRLQAGRLHRLGVLSADACHKAVHRCFAQFGVQAEHWEDRIVNECGLWPQHMAGYLTEAMKALREYPLPNGRGFNASAADFQSAIANGDVCRYTYYADREAALGRSQEKARKLARSLDDTGPAVSREAIRETLEAQLGLPLSDDAFYDFMQDSLHAGFLAPDATVRTAYVMPIPSFTAFLRGEDSQPQDPLSLEFDSDEDPSP